MMPERAFLHVPETAAREALIRQIYAQGYHMGAFPSSLEKAIGYATSQLVTHVYYHFAQGCFYFVGPDDMAEYLGRPNGGTMVNSFRHLMAYVRMREGIKITS